MHPSLRRCAIGAATAATLIVSAASPALAAGPRHTHARPTTFAVRGVVVSVSGRSVKVLSRTATVGSRSTHDSVVTLTMTARTRRHTAAPVRPSRRTAALRTAAADSTITPGEEIAATGTVVHDQLVVTQETAAPLPAEALLGVVRVVSADGKTLAVTSRDQVNGDASERDHGDVTIVDGSAATFRSGSDTSTATIAAPRAGDFVVVLGEAQDGDMAAAKVYSFSTAPALVAGTVSAADAAARTLSITPQDASDDNGDGSSSDVTVDAGTADVVLNGDSGAAAPSFPAPGNQVLAVGAAGSATDSLTAALVFGFTSADNGPVDEHGDGGGQGD